MTDDKDFKHLVRGEARRTGRSYAQVRADMRPPAEPPAPAWTPSPEEVAELFEAFVAAVKTGVFGRDEAIRLVGIALLTPGNVLLADVAGNGMTALGQRVAQAIGGRLVSLDGRMGLEPEEIAAWRPEDVVVIAHFDGLEVADQVAVVNAGRVPAIVLAKRHPIPERMPHPPDDDTRVRFLFGPELGPIGTETQLRIVSAMRDGDAFPSASAVFDVPSLQAMRAAVADVAVPDRVRRFAVAAIAAIPHDDALVSGGSIITTLSLVQASAAAALAAGRGEATIDDVRGLLSPVLAHRVVFRPDVQPDLAALVDRVSRAALAAD